jgi:uncharacterized coiled-coil DUF342 family protein
MKITNNTYNKIDPIANKMFAGEWASPKKYRFIETNLNETISTVNDFDTYLININTTHEEMKTDTSEITKELFSIDKEYFSTATKDLSQVKELFSEPKELISEVKELLSQPKELNSEVKELLSEVKELNSEPKELLSEVEELLSEPKELLSQPTKEPLLLIKILIINHLTNSQTKYSLKN